MRQIDANATCFLRPGTKSGETPLLRFSSLGLAQGICSGRGTWDAETRILLPPDAFLLSSTHPFRANNQGMFHVTMLGSGSAGNATLVVAGQTRVLIDAGLSARQIRQRLEHLGTSFEELDGVLLTHEHQDHAGAIGVLARKFETPVYCNSLTAESLTHLFPGQKLHTKIFQTGGAFSIKDLRIETFQVPHDAVEPVGYAVHFGSQSIGFLTDLGHTTKLAMQRVKDVHTLIIETNHDEKLLQDCAKRPWSVKQRILSRHGHLSNHAAARVISELASESLKQVILCHLSRDCNNADLAAGTVDAVLRENGIRDLPTLFCASQTEVTPTFMIPTAPARVTQDEFAFG